MFFKTASLRSEEGKAKGVVEPSRVEEKDIDATKQPVSGEGETETLVERPILITIPEIFGEIERPPVKFYHDKHAIALEDDGCNVCHPKDEKEKLLFTFPKERDEKSEDALMNSYHDSCIGCHNEKLDVGEKAGPVTC